MPSTTYLILRSAQGRVSKDARLLLQRFATYAKAPANQIPSWGRHPDRLQPRMRGGRARFHPVAIRAHIVSWQVPPLAPGLPISPDLRLGLRRSPSELAVGVACRRDPPHRRLESRVLEIEVNPKLCAQVGMPIRDHVDPFARRNLLDILQAVE